MVTTKLNLSMTEPQVRQIYAKQGDTGRVLDITLDQTPEDGTLRILRPDGVEVTSEAVTGGEVESGSSFDSLTEADVTELTVGIEPVQDLNGYDAPWVGGAGKNKLNMDALQIGKAWNGASSTARAVVYSVCQPNTQYTLSFSGADAFEQVFFIEKTSEDATTNNRLTTVTSPFTFTTNATSGVFGLQFNKTAIASSDFANFTAQIELGSAATAWQPYSNICPITGHDEVEVTQTGKNFLENLGSSVTTNGITYTVNSDGSFTVKGTATARANLFLRTVSNPQHLPPGNYILSQGNAFGAGEAFLELAIRRANGTTQYANLNGRDNFAFALNEGDYIYQPYFSVYSGTTIDATIYPMVRLASEADSTFEPYRSNTYTTSLGQTVYGGTLDMVSGVLTVDSRYLTVNDFTFMSSGTSAGGLYWVNVPQTYPTGVNDNSDTNVCSHAPYTSSGDVGWGSTTPIYTVNSSGYPARIYVDSTTYADFQTKYATLQAVYKLAEPVEYQLTAQQIKTLVGTNNVWASSGDIVNITFTYGGLLSELPSEATEIVGKCYCDVEQNGVSSMPFTLNVKKNERES